MKTQAGNPFTRPHPPSLPRRRLPQHLLHLHVDEYEPKSPTLAFYLLKERRQQAGVRHRPRHQPCASDLRYGLELEVRTPHYRLELPRIRTSVQEVREQWRWWTTRMPPTVQTIRRPKPNTTPSSRGGKRMGCRRRTRSSRPQGRVRVRHQGSGELLRGGLAVRRKQGRGGYWMRRPVPRGRMHRGIRGSGGLLLTAERWMRWRFWNIRYAHRHLVIVLETRVNVYLGIFRSYPQTHFQELHSSMVLRSHRYANATRCGPQIQSTYAKFYTSRCMQQIRAGSLSPEYRLPVRQVQQRVRHPSPLVLPDTPSNRSTSQLLGIQVGEGHYKRPSSTPPSNPRRKLASRTRALKRVQQLGAFQFQSYHSSRRQPSPPLASLPSDQTLPSFPTRHYHRCLQ